MHEDGRLDRADFLAVVKGLGLGPGAAQIGRPFHVHAPAGVLGAGAAQERAVVEHHRLVLDGAELPLRQATGLGPRVPAVA